MGNRIQMEKNGIKISKMVGIYIFSVICLLGITVIAVFFAISMWMSSGSYAEPREVEKSVEKWIADSIVSNELDPSSFPQDAGCIITDEGGNEVFASFAGDEKKLRKYAEEHPTGESRILKGQDIYIRFEIGTEAAYVHYSLEVKNEYMILALILVLFVLEVMVPTVILIRRMKRAIHKVEERAEELKAHDLSGESISTGVRELDEISAAMDDLKKSLSESLESKWRDEVKTRSEMAQIAHDLKTPLTIIRGNADLLMENTDNEEDIESLGIIIESAEKITRSILEILEKK